jgi:hypothetical protein
MPRQDSHTLLVRHIEAGARVNSCSWKCLRETARAAAAPVFVALRSPLVERQEAHVIRTFLIAVLTAVVVVTPLAAQDGATERFFIERIEVRNAKRVSTDVVVTESRLRSGQTYSEAELRDASTRLSRLPYLLSVDFSLEKGTERGKHVLVLSITETKPFFYLLDIRPIVSDESRRNGGLNVEYTDRLGSIENQGVLGFRWFVGRRGAFHLALTGQDDNRDYTRDYTSLTAGYTQYDLFGTRAFATLNLKRALDGNGGVITPQIVVGMPLSPNQTVTLQVDGSRYSDTYRASYIVEFPGPVFNADLQSEAGQVSYSAKWAYNTTNQPFLPTRGRRISVTPEYFSSDLRYQFGVYNPELHEFSIEDFTNHLHVFSVDFDAAQFWELSEVNSASAGFRGNWGNGRQSGNAFPRTDADQRVGILYGGFSHSLWDREQQRHGDSRLELNGLYASRSHDITDGYGDREGFQISGSWVRRSSWGTLRLGVGYAF